MREELPEHHLEIAYADRRDNRMVILGGGEFDTLAEQDHAFDELPELTKSDFIVDYYDAEGMIAKDKCVSQATVEAVLGRPIAELIEDGRRREDELSAQIRDGRAALQPQEDGE